MGGRECRTSHIDSSILCLGLFPSDLAVYPYQVCVTNLSHSVCMTRDLPGNLGNNHEVWRIRMILPGGPGRGNGVCNWMVVRWQLPVKCSYKITPNKVLSPEKRNSGPRPEIRKGIWMEIKVGLESPMLWLMRVVGTGKCNGLSLWGPGQRPWGPPCVWGRENHPPAGGAREAGLVNSDKGSEPFSTRSWDGLLLSPVKWAEKAFCGGSSFPW